MRPMLIGLILLLLLPAACAGGQSVYSAKPLQGRVVEAVTGEPVEGVIVVAQWILYEATVGGQNPRKRLQVLETVTAQDGGYAFPGWGPKPNPTVLDASKGYLCCFLTNRDPQLNFFKPGYKPLTLLNRSESESDVRASEWDGKSIMLQPFTGSAEDWARALSFLQEDLSWGHQLDWRTCPRMVLTIEDERGRLPPRPKWPVSGLRSLGTSRDAVIREMRERP